MNKYEVRVTNAHIVYANTQEEAKEKFTSKDTINYRVRQLETRYGLGTIFGDGGLWKFVLCGKDVFCRDDIVKGNFKAYLCVVEAPEGFDLGMGYCYKYYSYKNGLTLDEIKSISPSTLQDLYVISPVYHPND